jgi:Tol biopolymer transport system component
VYSLYQKPTGSATAEELLFKSTTEQAVPYSWSPDGKFILHRSMNNGRFNTGVLSLDGKPASHPYNPVPFLQSFGQISPDGRWMVYNSNQTGRVEVFLQSFPTAGGIVPVSKDGGIFPMWRADGKELFYYAADSQLMAVPVSMGATVELGAAETLFRVGMLNGPNSAVNFRGQYDVTPNGQRFLINLPVESAEEQSITVLLNWAATLGAGR